MRMHGEGSWHWNTHAAGARVQELRGNAWAGHPCHAVKLLAWASCLLLMVMPLGALAQEATAPPTAPPEPPKEAVVERVHARPSIAEAVADGVGFLVKSQNADGSWGTGTETRGTEVYSMVPGSHDAFRVATTALCVMALREAGETEAHGRGVDYLVKYGQARRDDADKIYNVWAHTYALQAL